ncbi:S-adenosyl-L-methionine-dependent methyltransferase [Phyllosticta citrichinensis]|uniref:tRNA (guanine(26)-N(2))-dimethyltransferase n=1 Tax=Phyllosticta citrichinensis TaxID=1130410 RepID=A0ABR1XW28_9PEZI
MESATAPTTPAASLSDPPKAGQRIRHEGKEYTTVREGLAHILVPPNAATSTDPKKATKGESDEERQKVFYNPIQQFNRDLSVLAIYAFGESFLAEKEAKRKQQDKRKAKTKPNRKRKPVGDGHEEQHTGNEYKRQRTGDEAEKKAEVAEAAPGASEQQKSSGETTNFDDSALKDQDLLAAVEPRTEQPASEEQNASTNGAAKKPAFRILDALSASGLRALRYAKEIPFATSITGNDLSPDAVRAMKLNVIHNQVEDVVKPNAGNAVAHMYQFVGEDITTASQPKYHVIDLDPYGSAVPFLDGALQAVADGGLLCVTCTDAGVFNSFGYPEKAYSLYGGLPIKGHHAHEGGLRLILHSIATTAAKYGIAIEPLLSLSIDFYARVFVRVKKSPADVKFLAGKSMLVYNCDSGCGAWTTQFIGKTSTVQGKKGPFYKYGMAQGPSAPTNCPHCAFKTHIAGPMYGGPLHNPAFIEKILGYLPDLDREVYATTERIEGMLRTAHDETLFSPAESASPYVPPSAPQFIPSSKTPKPEEPSPIIPQIDPALTDSHPFFFDISGLARVLHCQAPSGAAIKGALRHAGYRTTRTHCRAGAIKTDAPWAAVWEIMREWVRQKAPFKEGAVKEGTAGWGVWKNRRLRGESTAQEKETEQKKQEREACEKVAQGNETAQEKEKEQEKKAGKETAQSNETAPLTQGVEKETQLERLHKIDVVFDEKLGKDRDDKKLVRYQQNPRANWGPMNRAK